MAYGSAQWNAVLLTILLGFRDTWKEDLQATIAEMNYGAPMRFSGEFLCPSKQNADQLLLWGETKSQCSVYLLQRFDIMDTKQLS
ncbi:hypothetical protein NPIL_540341 [Nephila pilipes]|uniref:Uncharacterized protein n=1 Tax=Nephila pilipes TaxID=299642 RepID=A0A8X6PNF6_NEPPI|nr:hypothetical protein NPIL_540341 [Nephila pilipes]